MRKPGKCRSCNIAYELTYKTGRHRLVDIGLICLVCNYAGKSLYHGQHEDLHGDTFECNSCNKYILYTDGAGTIWKDEIYFSDKEYLIREIDHQLSDNKSECLYIYNGKTIRLPMLTEWTSIADLYSKLEVFQTFS